MSLNISFMKVFLKLGLFTLGLFISRAGMAQLEKSHLPPSPNASGAITAADVNMDYYAGVANVSIPLNTLAGKDISIPVSLDYRTTGIKVADIASSVGLGWSLNANAFAVTRVVRGITDGSEVNCNTDGTGKIARNQVWWANFESCDAERDIFYFSCPSRSGKMFLDNSGQPQTMPYQDILIAPGIGSASTTTGRWEITDESGYTYYTGETYRTPVYHYYDIENSNTLIRASNANNAIFDLNNVNKAYSTVVETFLDGSRIARGFY
jgi:hypothetical protein